MEYFMPRERDLPRLYRDRSTALEMTQEGIFNTLYFFLNEFVPDGKKRDGGERGGISTGDGTDKKSKSKTARCLTTHENQSEKHEHNRKRVTKRANHGFGGSLIGD